MRRTILVLDSLLLAGLALGLVALGCFSIPVDKKEPSTRVVPLRTAEAPEPTALLPAAPEPAAPRPATPEPAAPQPAAPEPAPFDAEVHRAVERSLPFLEAEGVAWMRGELAIQKGRGCVSCHHVNYAVWSLNEARRIGLDAPGGALAELTREAIDFVDDPGVARSMILGPLLLGLDEDHAGLSDRLLDLQTSSGRWRARGQFPDQRRPVAESDAVATLWSLLVLPRSERADQAAEAALEWLASAGDGESNEWIAGRMLLADHLQRTEELDAARQRLRAAQNDDGGWGWTAGDASNPFSTGQALYALARVEGRADRRAQDFLIADQLPDGSWPLESSEISSTPSHERDQIYRYWGTAWATIGLARSASLAIDHDSPGREPSRLARLEVTPTPMGR